MVALLKVGFFILTHMKRYFASYWYWEDWKYGLYKSQIIDHHISLSVELLSNQDKFYSAAIKMINEWQISSAVQLSNKSRNRQAWIGQATCCFNHNASEESTKKAWWLLNTDTQIEANLTADRVINIYERYKGVNPCQKNIWELTY
jgi:hypothetical protein